MEEWSYTERWSLVTGASAGIGEEFARLLAARGSHLVLTARRAERLEQLAAELSGSYGVRTAVVSADLSRTGSAGELWRQASEGRTIDLLINNAGFGAKGAFDEVPLERQVEMVQVNCTSPLELAHTALREMKGRRGGGIINVSSIAAFQPVPLLATYAASKAFLLSLTEAMAAEAAGSGVRVLALCPGRTPTEFQGVAGTGDAGSFGVRTAEQVAEAGLVALERGRVVEVPGWENRIATTAVRVMPRGVTRRVLKPLVRWATRGG